MKQYDPNIHTLAEMESEFPKTTLLYQRFFDMGLRGDSLARALWVVSATCNQCHEADVGCQCWNDE